MKSILSILVLLLVHQTVLCQVFFQESFENDMGWGLSHQFDDGNDDYSKRDSAVALNELGYILFGQDGTFVIAAEDTDGVLDESPEDGVITLTIDPVNIGGMTDIELVVQLSCNAQDMAYDQRSQVNGDYLDFEVKVDGGAWTTIGQFNSSADGNSSSTLYQDVDMDGDGGELGELPVTSSFQDFVMPWSITGNTAEVRAVYRMNGSDEVIVLDNFRLRESLGDDVPPSVYSAQVMDQNTLEIVFQEPLGSNAEQTFLYSGISGLTSATLQTDQQTVILEYSSDFVLGEPYQLVIFSVQDEAGNPMSGAYTFPFYFNPTTPDVLITEVMYNDPSVEDSLEFIEIYNRGSVDAILGGFRLEDAVNHTLASVSIAPGEFYLVARNAAAAENFYSLSFYDYSGQLSDNSEEIRLVNVDGVLLDSVAYLDMVPWPSAADGTGPSMELVSVEADNSVGGNWVASENGLGFINGLTLSATPGTLPGTVLPTVEFDIDDVEVNEEDGVIELTLFISGANSSQSVVELSYVSGSATSPEDHGSNTISTLQLPANSDGIEMIAFPLVNDTELEGIEHFTLGITAVSNCQIGLNDEALIIIADDEFVSPPLWINELQSSNISTVMDDIDEYDDWFEIYNPNSFSVDLAGYYLSDDPLNTLKDRLEVETTETIIEPFGYMLLWADEQGGQGPLHMNFKLSSAGESLILTSPNGVSPVDNIDFGAVASDDSFGRFCDGEDTWTVLTVPSPGYGNCVNGIQEFTEELSIYPNPSSAFIFLPVKGKYEVFDAQGSSVLKGTGNQIDVHGLGQGMYSILFEKSSSTRFVKE